MRTAPSDTSAAFASGTVPGPDQDNESSLGQRIAAHCRRYQGADIPRSLIQLTTTLAFFIGLAAMMVVFFQQGWFWACALLWLPAGGLLVRLFIIQHDCGHGSYFRNRSMNDLVGRALSLLTVTPYSFWRDAHNVHHAGSGNLSRRGIGSIDTLTVREYEALPKRKQLAYRLYRHPLMVLLIGPPLYVIAIQRLPLTATFSYFEDYRSVPYAKIWRSILALDAALVLFYGSLGMLIGFMPLLAAFLPPVMIAAWAGGWLFFVQHQFEDTYWKDGKEWNFRDAALHGSSHYVLPRVLQWFTGNIGLHHIHHLCSAIPNYRLQECMEGNAELAGMNRMGIRQSLQSIPLALWDEELQKMVSFSRAKQK
jgi:acyl-lipid omega-6 desaturase (Delta-12 desaturase)